MDWEAILSRMVATMPVLIGAIIGGVFTLRAARQAARREHDRERKREEREMQNMLDSLGVEIDTLWSFHMARIGAMVENLQQGDTLQFYYPLTQDYFTVYNSNAGKIGSVKDRELRKAIVVTYNKCKKIVDGFKYNNVLFRDYHNYLNSDNQMAAKAKFAEMQAYALMVKEDHFEVKAYIENMLNLLDKRSV